MLVLRADDDEVAELGRHADGVFSGVGEGHVGWVGDAGDFLFDVPGADYYAGEYILVPVVGGGFA